MREFYGSGRFQMDNEAGLKVLKVLLWTLASAAIVFLLNIIKIITFPPEYLWAVPIVNTLLVALQQFVSDNSNK